MKFFYIYSIFWTSLIYFYTCIKPNQIVYYTYTYMINAIYYYIYNIHLYIEEFILEFSLYTIYLKPLCAISYFRFGLSSIFVVLFSLIYNYTYTIKKNYSQQFFLFVKIVKKFKMKWINLIEIYILITYFFFFLECISELFLMGPYAFRTGFRIKSSPIYVYDLNIRWLLKHFVFTFIVVEL